MAKQIGKQDFMMMARFTGIMIINRQVFVLYNMMHRMLRWYESCEFSTLSVIKEILMSYAPQHRLRLQEINAICLGQRLEDVKNMVWGRSPERPTKENEVRIRNLSSASPLGWKHQFIPEIVLCPDWKREYAERVGADLE